MINEYKPNPLPDPIEAIEYHMERLGLHRRDLEPYLGSRARVSEILNRKRPLTLQMIRRISAGLGISLDVLAQKYPLARDVKMPVNKLSSDAAIHEDGAKYD